MELYNEMEAIVFGKIDEIIKGDSHISKCEKCRLDVAALALNSLSPKYTVTARGQVFAKVSILNQQFGADVVSAIVKAINKVKEHPMHEL